ncbi:hypothetical protein PVAG01_05810 [Phlyctema vagabunda]|uniref:Heterokaryon incompatibility domain-containing protein n=1 Tax=Phlyctema vagabunda TaxID=108571 RepID=A0ABR4PEB4_9HELO
MDESLTYNRQPFIPLSLTEPRLVPQTVSRLRQCTSTSYLKSFQARLEQSSVRILGAATKRKLLAIEQLNSQNTAWDTSSYSRLTELAPGSSKAFVPKNDLVEKFVFRLIGGTDHNGDDFNSYVTLSYCWGVSEEAPLADDPSDIPLPTSSTMFQAIKGERQSENEGLWVDRVCIDQDNEVEKQISIGQMNLVYNRARVVVVALDDVMFSNDEVEAIAAYTAEYEKSHEIEFKTPFEDDRPRYMSSRPVLVSAYLKIISSRWFERAWCFHEMRLGRSHVFLMKKETSVGEDHQQVLRFTGTFLLNLNDLCIFFQFGVRDNSISVAIRNTFFQQIRDALDFLHSLPNPANFDELKRQSLVKNSSTVFALAAGGNPKQLDETLRSFDACCDKISITLNISDYGFAVQPNDDGSLPFTSEDECYRRLLLLALAARDPLALCTIGRPLRLTQHPQTSWLCRPIPRGSVIGSYQLPPLREDAKIMLDDSAAAEYVQLDILAFKPIEIWHQPSAENTEKAKVFMSQFVDNNIGSEFWSWCPDDKIPIYITLHTQVIASVFECGMKWIQDIYESFIMKEEQSIRATSAFSSFFDDHFQIPTEAWWNNTEKAESARLIMSFINRLIWFGTPWHLQIEHFEDFSWRPICASFGEDARAMCFAPPDCEVSIVELLRSKKYRSLERAWVLRKRAGSHESSWTQLGKTCLFANAGVVRQLDENPDFTTCLPQQKIYGRMATTAWPPQIHWAGGRN